MSNIGDVTISAEPATKISKIRLRNEDFGLGKTTGFSSNVSLLPSTFKLGSDE